MSGWGFGGFDLSAINEIGTKLQQFKDDVESSIDASIRGDHSTGKIAGECQGRQASDKFGTLIHFRRSCQ